MATLYHLPVLSSVQTYLRTHALVRPGDRVGIAVSGGADSVALLRALLELRSELGIVLSVVHLHHGIRRAEADADAQFVADLANSFDLPLHLERANVPAHSEKEKLSLETSARELRYAFFKRLLEADACDKIATAHTLDDQAETVLLRILRGTGTRGLAAIPPLRDASPQLAARIIRPLLATRRAQIETYLHSLHQPWREDATNQDPRHLRNRIRHQLLPQLERDYNPALRQSLVNLAEIARAEEHYWNDELSRLAPLLTQHDDALLLDRPRLLALPLALQRRLLVDLADWLDLPIHFDDVEQILRLAAHPGSEHTFENGWQVESTKPALEIRRTSDPSESPCYEAVLPVPGSVDLPISLRLQASIIESDEASRYNAAALLRQDQLESPLRVRNWRPGDRFWPVGTKQAEKLKRLFQQHHIPSGARSSWPVVLSGETIVWVRDFPVASGYQAHHTNSVLVEALPLDQAETRHD